MAVLVLFTGKISHAHYELIRREIKWDLNHPIGAICHIASFDEEGHIHVADVWQSEDSFNAFVVAKLAPAFSRLGILPPHISIFPVHNMDVYKAIDAFRVK
jgi:hypothetical protein